MPTITTYTLVPEAKRPPQKTIDVYQNIRHYIPMESNLKITETKFSYTAYDCDVVKQAMYKIMTITRNDRQNISLNLNWRDK